MAAVVREREVKIIYPDEVSVASVLAVFGYQVRVRPFTLAESIHQAPTNPKPLLERAKQAIHETPRRVVDVALNARMPLI